MSTERRCIGFGSREGTCTNAAVTPAGYVRPCLWCEDCEAARRKRISEQLADLRDSFASEPRPGR